MKTLKIYILNTLDIGIDVANTLRRHLDVKGMIGLSDRPRSDRISGFTYLKPYCDDYGLDFVEVDSYTMRAAGDREKLLLLDIDLLIVAGWQRSPFDPRLADRALPRSRARHTRQPLGDYGGARALTTELGTAARHDRVLHFDLQDRCGH